ncbi:DNA topoisomerase [Fructobacillus tropaeoli]|uniref:DNA topoisomerase n=1 Tax=Fructobacillus tropaeoli TaxID=709323 RepID=UPI001945196A|nr:DNA topoisomerase [Fructobacillus tropaeoli]GIC69409.1 type IA DNA topoisomerase [Fructobacillus tropaeoli]
MSKYLIITEKPSARKNFEKALGGKAGHFDQFDYELVSLHGHMLGLAAPENQVPKELSKKYQSWSLDDLPWDISPFQWRNQYTSSYNPKTKKESSTKREVDAIKEKAKIADAIVIATDTDPSGEGELLAWEVLFAINWKGKVLRANFLDESAKSIQKAMTNLRDISDPTKDGDLIRGNARNRWDFISMQLTRIATTASRQYGGYNILSRQGRLKSAMLYKVYEQEEAIKNYVKIPYFENRYKDNAGNIYSRSVKKDDEQVPFRFSSKMEAENEKEGLISSGTPVIISTKKKETKPPKLLDLSSLSALLAKDGYKAKEVLETYQKLYEDQIVSYPRTEDKTITPEQFNDSLPNIDKIADLVGVDVSKLTNKAPRKTHVKAEGAHGANRPGPRVPISLADLKKYGMSGPKIYEILSKNFLAMFAENYQYEQIKAEIKENPSFTTMINRPLVNGWHDIYQEHEEEETNYKNIGKNAELFIHEGQNSKPSAPTWSWLKTFLQKNEIGTGATRTSTYADLTSPTKKQDAYIQDKKGKIQLTDVGRVAAFVVKGTFIAQPTTTKQIFDIFDQVGKFKVDIAYAMKSSSLTVAHDMPIIIDNAKKMQEVLGTPSQKLVVPDIVSGIWTKTNQEIQFNRSFSGHRFTDGEVEKLLNNEKISIQATSKKGKVYTASGQLEEKVINGRTYVNFVPDFSKG